MKEIISIHAGQAGVQVGNSCWELFCLEHGIDPSGQLSENSNIEGSISTFFSESNTGKYMPRAIYLDLDATTIDEIRKGHYKELFSPEQLISGKEDSSNNYCVGNLLHSRNYGELTLDKIRLQAEKCSSLQGFLFTFAIGGGTGSGMSTFLSERINSDYNKKDTVAFSVFPSPRLSSIIVEPFNSVFALHDMVEHFSSVVVFDNEALYDISAQYLNVDVINYSCINKLIAQSISSITASMRFEGTLNSDMTEFHTNLIPFQRVKFLLSSYSPIISAEKEFYNNFTVDEITKACFEPFNMMAKCDPRLGKYMACCLMYRGDVVPKEVNSAVSYIKNCKTIEFVDWCPTGFKCGINSQKALDTNNSEIKSFNRAACMVSNNSAIRHVFKRINNQFDKMFSKRAYVYWYVTVGLHDCFIEEAKEDLELIEKSYQEFENPENIPN